MLNYMSNFHLNTLFVLLYRKTGHIKLDFKLKKVELYKFFYLKLIVNLYFAVKTPEITLKKKVFSR